MEDQPHQPTIDGAEAVRREPRYKTLGVRLNEDLHARLSFIAQLNGGTLTDEILGAIEARVDAAQSDPELVARAEAVRAEIEREAKARQTAIAGFFGKGAVAGAQASESAAPTRRRTATKRTSAKAGR